MFAEAFQELAGFPELLGTSALREIAADDDEIRLEPSDVGFHRINQTLIVCPEMEVREMDNASHGLGSKRAPRRGVQKLRSSNNFASMPKPSARFCSMKFATSPRPT